jgi:hypothetical protein
VSLMLPILPVCDVMSDAGLLSSIRGFDLNGMASRSVFCLNRWPLTVESRVHVGHQGVGAGHEHGRGRNKGCGAERGGG